MTLTTQAWGHDGKTYDGKDMRQLVESIFPNPDSGIVEGLATTQQGSPAATVQVSAGKAIVYASGSGLTGAYHVWNDASINSPTINPTTTNGRKDRLILRVSSGVPALEVVEGTASGSPAEPAITGDNYVELALITLPGSTTNITDAMITDRRVQATALGGVIPSTYALFPSASTVGAGKLALDTSTGRLWRSDGTNWRFYGPPAGIRTSASRTSGNVTLSSTTWASVDTGIDLTLPAVAGDLIEVRVSAGLNGITAGSQAYLDAMTVTGSNYFTSPNANTSTYGGGIVSGIASGSGYFQMSGTLRRTLVSGDISGGNVAVRLRYILSAATNQTLFATTTNPLYWEARNLGPAV